jgi:DNA mismatch endonuclease (patch repair protein)
MDKVSPETRSQVMARVKSKGNRSTEWRLRACLIRAGIRGWQVNRKDVLGSPDFVFADKRLAVFTDGCFWHGCPRCKKIPASNREYWTKKIDRNRRRDEATRITLKALGWTVVRIWEHELVSLKSVLKRISTRLT